MPERLSPNQNRPTEKKRTPLSKTEEVAMEKREVDVRALLMRLANFDDDLEVVVVQTYIVREGEYHTNFNADVLQEGIISVKNLKEGLAEGLREYDIEKRQKIRIAVGSGFIVPFASNTHFYLEPNLDDLKAVTGDYQAQAQLIDDYIARYKENDMRDKAKGTPDPFTRH